MIALSPSILIAAANTFAGVGDLSKVKRNPLAQVIRKAPVDGDLTPWSTAFLWHVGYWSHFDHDSDASSWPLPATADPNALFRYAVERHVCHVEPQAHDIFGLWSPFQGLFVRSGIILRVNGRAVLPNGTYYECTTLEGDTNRAGAARGKAAHRAKRFLSPDAGDRFLRWVDLDPAPAIEGGAP